MANVRQIRTGSKHGMISPETTGVEGLLMRSDPLCALVVGVVLMLLVVVSRRRCRSGKSISAATKPPRATHDPKPFAGFTRKPDCPACEQEAGLQRPPHTQGKGGLRYGPFDAGSPFVVCFKTLGLLALASRLERQMLRFGM